MINLLAIVIIITSTCITTVAQVYFNDSDPVIMKLGNNSFYEIGFRKTNGSIEYITDKTTGMDISLGSRDGNLWSIKKSYSDISYFGGANYDAIAANQFSYAWDALTGTLIFSYTPDSFAVQSITASVIVNASVNAFFDLQLSLSNNYNDTLEIISFPSNLVFMENEMQKAYLPIIPGIVLDASFFTQSRSFIMAYPGWPGVFADFIYQQLQGGSFAMYALFNSAPVSSLIFGYKNDYGYIPSTSYRHEFFAFVLDSANWTSPVMRIRISESIQAAIAGYRQDNGIDTLSSIKTKLGTKFDQTSKASLVKVDFQWPPLGFGITNYVDYDSVFSILPSPSIIHPVGYTPNGFDRDPPDFLPPNPDLGTTTDFRAMFDKAHDRGLLVMPYTNPTFWNDSSNTVLNQLPPLTTIDIAVIKPDGQPLTETYGQNTGIVVSPKHPFVESRVDTLMKEMTEDVLSDFVFEDQIGTRGFRADMNPFSDSLTAFLPGWIAHAKKHAAKGLATEMGFDRILEWEIGFHGGVLLIDRNGDADAVWGAGNWNYYPITSLMAHDKVFFYQHDLAIETPTHDLSTLSWNLAFGFMLNYDFIYAYLTMPDWPDWLEVVGAFQSHVVSRYADNKMLNYMNLMDSVTLSTFDSVTVVTNWSNTSSFTSGLHTISPEGALVASIDSTLTGGIFTAYNSISLSSGDHYLIVEKTPALDSIRVWQPLGNNTPLTILRPDGWTDPSSIHVYAIAKDNIIEVVKIIDSGTITFNWDNLVSGIEIDHYLLTSGINNSVNETETNITLHISPNPTHSETIITYQLPESGKVNITVLNLMGQQISVLTNKQQQTGKYTFIWNGKNENGETVPTGIYILRFSINEKILSKKILKL